MGDKTRVFIFELEAAQETGGDKLFEDLLKDSEKARKRTEVENRAFAPHNLARKQKAKADRERDLAIAQKLCRERPDLKRASRERLAEAVQQYVAHRGTKRSVKAIRRAFSSSK
jgi:hypothetical protein